ncbi:MAG TPA: response regulator [Rhodocyclaceae bacterium]|nr:response regulator [Rhodocyclaceae bacterium]HNH34967.1 response regulator [Rhodocyclaceae bacterium]
MTETEVPLVLVVEDEPVSLATLVENLETEGYRTASAQNGQVAWDLISAAPDSFDAILLDRVMPDMDGIEVLRRVKTHPAMAYTPVIMQTAMSADADVADGLRAGAFYYLTKPFSADTMLAIVAAAAKDHRLHRDLQRQARQTTRTLAWLRRAEFAFRTPEEARDIATLVAHAAPEPDRVVLGLIELMLNAVEHGNLEISYDEKTRLISEDRLMEEIRSRLALPEMGARNAVLAVERTSNTIRFGVIDEGRGFDWSEYLEMQPRRAFHTHGRGIAMARMISFDALEYRGRGNEVWATVNG